MSEVRRSGHGLLYFIIGALFATSIAFAIASYNGETSKPWMDQTIHGTANFIGDAAGTVGDKLAQAMPDKPSR